jgi:hypothetical protein
MCIWKQPKDVATFFDCHHGFELACIEISAWVYTKRSRMESGPGIHHPEDYIDMQDPNTTLTF